ncbi:MAG: hypothetical protein ACREC0_05665 [Methylocella sp.]
MKTFKTLIAAAAIALFAGQAKAEEMSKHCLDVVARLVETADVGFDKMDRQIAILSGAFTGRIQFLCTAGGEGITMRTESFPSNDRITEAALVGSVLTGAPQASLKKVIRSCTLKAEKERVVDGDQSDPVEMEIQKAIVTCTPTLYWNSKEPIPEGFKAGVIIGIP